eukprot:TRINITY_DN19417_c0_g1_i1.p1 TRINITY_DN19417_c0_g1~~TRINITY_DN19417_c0_g1_i1.p1  ORF type:complete len:673 (-),score=55.64 TRINITY_DN19417_c0_g1_i1:48-2066(-)
MDYAAWSLAAWWSLFAIFWLACLTSQLHASVPLLASIPAAILGLIAFYTFIGNQGFVAVLMAFLAGICPFVICLMPYRQHAINSVKRASIRFKKEPSHNSNDRPGDFESGVAYGTLASGPGESQSPGRGQVADSAAAYYATRPEGEEPDERHVIPAAGAQTISTKASTALFWFSFVILAIQLLATWQAIDAYLVSKLPPPGELIEIGEGRYLHLWCTGSGEQAVILESGFPFSSLVFSPLLNLHKEASARSIFEKDTKTAYEGKVMDESSVGGSSRLSSRVGAFSNAEGRGETLQSQGSRIASDLKLANSVSQNSNEVHNTSGKDSSPFRLCAYDRAGKGWSPPIGAADRPGSDVISDLRALISAANLGRPFLVGWSYGGSTMAALACSQPEDFSGLLILDGAPPNTFSDSEQFVTYLKQGIYQFSLANALQPLGYWRVQKWMGSLRGTFPPGIEPELGKLIARQCGAYAFPAAALAELRGEPETDSLVKKCFCSSSLSSASGPSTTLRSSLLKTTSSKSSSLKTSSSSSSTLRHLSARHEGFLEQNAFSEQNARVADNIDALIGENSATVRSQEGTVSAGRPPLGTLPVIRLLEESWAASMCSMGQVPHPRDILLLKLGLTFTCTSAMSSDTVCLSAGEGTDHFFPVSHPDLVYSNLQKLAAMAQERRSVT